MDIYNFYNHIVLNDRSTTLLKRFDCIHFFDEKETYSNTTRFVSDWTLVVWNKSF